MPPKAVAETGEDASQEQHDAATKLQKVQRGRSVRKDLAAKGKDDASAAEESPSKAKGMPPRSPAVPQTIKAEESSASSAAPPAAKADESPPASAAPPASSAAPAEEAPVASLITPAEPDMVFASPASVPRKSMDEKTTEVAQIVDAVPEEAPPLTEGGLSNALQRMNGAFVSARHTLAYLKAEEEKQRRVQSNEARQLRRECFSMQTQCEKYWSEVSALQKQMLEAELQRAPMSPSRTEAQPRAQRVPLRNGSAAGKGGSQKGGGMSYFDPTMSTASAPVR